MLLTNASIKKCLLGYLLVFVCAHGSTAQSTEIVEGKKIFTCTNSDHPSEFNNSFPTPDAAVSHYITTHMPPGYSLKAGSIEILENGWVTFITRKTGETDGHQGGKILGKVVCSEHADEMSWDPFATRKCLCHSGYVAKGTKCYEDTCAGSQGLDQQQLDLRNEVTQKLREKVNQVNEDFAKNGIPKADEKKIFPNKDEYDNFLAEANNPKMWPIAYGHVIERMTALAVERDQFLNEHLKYIPNTKQLQAGGGPDFRGRGPLSDKVEFDITTNDSVDGKMKNPAKQCYQYATYERLIDGYNNPTKKKLPPFK